MNIKTLLTVSLVSVFALSSTAQASRDLSRSGCWQGVKAALSRTLTTKTKYVGKAFVGSVESLASHLYSKKGSLKKVAGAMQAAGLKVVNLNEGGQSFAESIAQGLSWKIIAHKLPSAIEFADVNRFNQWFAQNREAELDEVMQNIADLSSIVHALQTGQDHEGFKVDREKLLKKIGRQKLAKFVDLLDALRDNQ